MASTDDRPTLFHTPQTRGGTTLWMNEELGDVCALRIVDLRAGEGASKAYRAINPMGKVPALTHRGVVVTEAAAICAYLADAFPARGLAPPPGDPSRGVYYRWMFFAPSCIEPTMLDIVGGAAPENAQTAGHGDKERVLTTIDAALSEGPYLLGDAFSAADVVFGSTLHFATLFGVFERTGVVASYLDRVTARPAFAAMVEKTAAQQATL